MNTTDMNTETATASTSFMFSIMSRIDHIVETEGVEGIEKMVGVQQQSMSQHNDLTGHATTKSMHRFCLAAYQFALNRLTQGKGETAFMRHFLVKVDVIVQVHGYQGLAEAAELDSPILRAIISAPEPQRDSDQIEFCVSALNYARFKFVENVVETMEAYAKIIETYEDIEAINRQP